MDSLLLAIAGGSIGAIAVMLGAVPQQVRAHDRRVGELDDDLGQWVADEQSLLERRMRKTTDEYGSRGELGSDGHVGALAALKGDLLRRYQAQVRDAERKRAALRDTEGPRHAAWRWIAVRGDIPTLRVPSKAAPIIETWREPAAFEGNSVMVEDPTQRTLDQALAEISKPPEFGSDSRAPLEREVG